MAMPKGSINKVILVGHLGRDPEVRYTASGDAVADVSLATTEYYKDKNGEKKREDRMAQSRYVARSGRICQGVAKKRTATLC